MIILILATIVLLVDTGSWLSSEGQIRCEPRAQDTRFVRWNRQR